MIRVHLFARLILEYALVHEFKLKGLWELGKASHRRYLLEVHEEIKLLFDVFLVLRRVNCPSIRTNGVADMNLMTF